MGLMGLIGGLEDQILIGIPIGVSRGLDWVPWAEATNKLPMLGLGLVRMRIQPRIVIIKITVTAIAIAVLALDFPFLPTMVWASGFGDLIEVGQSPAEFGQGFAVGFQFGRRIW
jgi:hypothetical protein